ncbi:MAG: hypothetical protein ACM3NQ_21445 [Bacteroidales bacterium]
MHSIRRRIVLAACLAGGLAFVLVAQIAAAGAQRKRNADDLAISQVQRSAGFPAKLAGAWVARVATIDDEPAPATVQWSYVVAPDNSGRRATFHGSVDMGFPGSLVPANYTSPLMGELVITGPDTAAFDSLWYWVQKDPDGSSVLVAIGRASGTAVYDEPGKATVTDHFEIYLSGVDADKDGIPDCLPDCSASPYLVKSFTVVSHDTRMPFLAVQ